jgi:hypothetical protein
MPVGPVLPSLTKNRVTHRPHVRPPTSRQVQVETQPVKASHDSRGQRPIKAASSGTESDLSASTASDEELLYETTV